MRVSETAQKAYKSYIYDCRNNPTPRIRKDCRYPPAQNHSNSFLFLESLKRPHNFMFKSLVCNSPNYETAQRAAQTAHACIY
jgi:hypothetical protein